MSADPTPMPADKVLQKAHVVCRRGSNGHESIALEFIGEHRRWIGAHRRFHSRASARGFE